MESDSAMLRRIAKTGKLELGDAERLEKIAQMLEGELKELRGKLSEIGNILSRKEPRMAGMKRE